MSLLCNGMKMSKRAGGGASYAAEVLADSPVAYWRLGESSGTTAADEVGSYDGIYTPNSGGAWTGGTLGATGPGSGVTAADFDTGYVGQSDLSAFAYIHNTLVFTVEFLVKITALTTRQCLLESTPYSAERGFFISFENGAGVGTKSLRCLVSRGISGPTNAAIDIRSADNVITDSDWHLVQIVNRANNATSAEIYVDDVLQSSSVAIYNGTGAGNSTRPTRIGSSTVGLQFVGHMCDVAMYNAALSTTRLSAHYAASGL